MGPTILFTHLKIILLQCFQFSATINSIQTDPSSMQFFVNSVQSQQKNKPIWHFLILLSFWLGSDPNAIACSPLTNISTLWRKRNKYIYLTSVQFPILCLSSHYMIHIFAYIVLCLRHFQHHFVRATVVFHSHVAISIALLWPVWVIVVFAV